MAYKVIHKFADLQDLGHVYAIGDTYPRKGHKSDPRRISELLGASNKMGKALIEEIPEKKPAKAEKKPSKKAED